MTEPTNETTHDEPQLVVADEVDVEEAQSGDVSADAESPAVLDAILGATDAESPDEADVDEPSPETPREKYARLLREGVKPSRLIATTDNRGALIDVQVQ